MIQKPRLKCFLTIYPITDEAWGIRGGNGEFWSVKLHDPRAVRAFGALLPYLNGRHSTDALLADVTRQGIESDVAVKLLERLEAASLIEEADPAGLSKDQLDRFQEQIRFFSQFTSEGGARFQARLLASRVAVVAGGQLAESLCRVLASSGFGRVTLLPLRSESEGAPERTRAAEALAHDVIALDRQSILPENHLADLPNVVVVAHTAHDPELMESMDAFSKRHGIPWMLVRATTQSEGWVGPLFIPGDTASYLSLEARLRGNMSQYDEYVAFDAHVRSNGRPAAEAGGLVAFAYALAGVAAVELVKLVSDITVPALAGKFISVSLGSLETDLHEVLRFPRLEDEAYSRPGVAPWKEVSYDAAPTRRA